MTLGELLPQLESVRARGNGRHAARCPAHADKNPSLSISEGEKGILLKCWAGCPIAEICRSLGIEQRDLFFNALNSNPQRRQLPAPPARVDRRALAFQFELGALDLRMRAERVIEAGKGLHVAGLSDDELDRAIGHMDKAHTDIERAEMFEGVADGLRFKEFYERESREQRQRVA